MDKRSLIALIYKDLYELKVLTSGFSEMEYFPKTLVDLSVDKAKNIADCLQKLPMNAYEHQELFFDFVQEPITKSQELIKNQNKETKISEKIEVFEEQKIEEDILDELTIEEEEDVDEEILEEQQEVEEQIEIVETQSEVVIEQPKIEEKKIETENFPSVQEKIEPIVEIPVDKPILQSKVSESKQPFGISIADRFRFQRELFDGNGEKFSKSLTDFNEMETLEQAQNYIVQKLKLDLNKPVVQAFIEILKRKLN